MLACLLLGSLVWLDNPVEVGKGVTLAALPDDSDYFIEQPTSFDIDARGHFYVLDGEAKTIFHWDEKGAFLGAIGEQGQGPGEFVLAGRGGARGAVAVVDDALYVYDGAKRKILVFGLDGEFQKEFEPTPTRAFIRGFFAVDDSRYIIHRTRRDGDERVNEAVLMSRDGKIERTFASREEDGFRIRGSDRRTARFTLRAFNPTLAVAYNAVNGETLVGYGGAPSFEVFDKDGGKRVVKIPMVQRDVTAADKEEFAENLSSNGRRSSRLSVDFPEKMPYYDRILPVGDRGYLAFTASPYYRDIKGVFVDRQGKPQGRFDMRCGQNGSIMSARGRLLCARLDDEGEFILEELKL